jgi:hypothetical protein
MSGVGGYYPKHYFSDSFADIPAPVSPLPSPTPGPPWLGTPRSRLGEADARQWRALLTRQNALAPRVR